MRILIKAIVMLLLTFSVCISLYLFFGIHIDSLLNSLLNCFLIGFPCGAIGVVIGNYLSDKLKCE